MVSEGDLLWEPSKKRQADSNMRRYMAWLAEHRGLTLETYEALWDWSNQELEAFWSSIWDYFDVIGHGDYDEVLEERTMPGAHWFPGVELNYAEHALRRRDEHVAIVYRSEDGNERRITYGELAEEVARAAEGLRRLGVERGDRVAAFAPNCPETVICFLAAVSLGAVWSSCSPEFGVGAVLDRFEQIEPKVLFAIDGYQYGGKPFDRRAQVDEIRRGIDSLEVTILVQRLEPDAELGKGFISWDELTRDEGELAFEPVPFDHPLWILYSSGTTGLPKAIVHGHGGILLELYKTLSLHSDLGEEDRFFWFTTTGWMMWNYLVSGLLIGTTIVLYDGSPGYPDLDALWKLASETGVTYFGTSAPFLLRCRKEGLTPSTSFNLSALHSVGSTGAPLPAEGFEWVYEHVGNDLLLGSVSGGTDVCTAFILSCPLLPVHAGEIQCRALGAQVEAFDENGEPVVDQVGELVICQPMPSMPLFFWNDDDGRRLKESYFSMFPGIWRHGDWIKITPRGSCVVYGRSDSTLNRGGVRMGTSEFYRVVDSIPEVVDSLVVDTAGIDQGKLWLFLVLRSGVELDDALTSRLKSTLRSALSPRHVPDEIRAIPEVPRTLSGKKLEVPIKRILNGTPMEQAVNVDTLANPGSIDPFLALVD